MNPIPIQTVAITFKVVGALIGLPSLAVLGLYGINEIRNRLTAAPGKTNFGENPDAILLMLKGITESIGALARVAGGVGQFLFTGLAIAAGAGLVFAVALWFAGRGLHAQAQWARICAAALLVLAVLPSLLLALSAKNFVRVAMLLIVIVCALGLHTLWLGYAPQNR